MVQHLPLKRVMQDCLGKEDHQTLLTLLLPVQKATEQNQFIKKLVDTGEIFQTQAWSSHQAHSFLQAISVLESSGIVVKVPNWWNSQNPSRPKINIKIGKHQASSITTGKLLDFNLQLVLQDGQEFTAEEWETLFKTSENFVKIKGHWVELDKSKLEDVLTHWRAL